jgi:PPIC-type PPIASE domain
MSRRCKEQPTRKPRWRLVFLVGCAEVIVAIGLIWFRVGPGTEALAQSANPQGPPPASAPAGAPSASSSDYSQRVVAYLYDSIPITREELGEYLIARLGAEKLELLVNKRIIELACKERNIEVTAAEVEAALEENLSGLSVSREVFVKEVLKGYKKTLYEWKEDVLRPKLLMTKLVRDKVTSTEEDLRKAFEAYYGEKVECRLILYPKSEENRARAEYPSIRDSEEAFAQKAKQQASPHLAAVGGKLDKPLGRYTIGNDELEREIFSLQPGDVSRVMGTPEGAVVVKCDKRIPADTTVNFETVKPQLIKDVIERKIQLEIKETFAKLSEKANPRLLLEGAQRKTNLAAEVRRDLSPVNTQHHTIAGPGN